MSAQHNESLADRVVEGSVEEFSSNGSTPLLGRGLELSVKTDKRTLAVLGLAAVGCVLGGKYLLEVAKSSAVNAAEVVQEAAE
jgi:hypothetical protein